MESLMKKLLDAGYPKMELRHSCTSLFVYCTPLVESVINEYCKENKVDRESFTMLFRDSYSGKMMYELYDKYNPNVLGTLQ